jgi:type 1 glutamine amidotransferase
MEDNAVRLAVITGSHPFEVPPFVRLFRELEGVDAYIQDLDNYCQDLAQVREWYDAVLFYNMHAEPTASCREIADRMEYGRRGMVVLHHGMLAFMGWPLWSGLVGINDRHFRYKAGETVRVEIADPTHPITRGIAPWSMVDEVYAMHEPSPGCQVLLTTDHPDSLHALAWTRTVGQVRVFVLASGHGAETYANESFRTVLARGIAWAAGRIG